MSFLLVQNRGPEQTNFTCGCQACLWPGRSACIVWLLLSDSKVQGMLVCVSESPSKSLSLLVHPASLPDFIAVVELVSISSP